MTDIATQYEQPLSKDDIIEQLTQRVQELETQIRNMQPGNNAQKKYYEKNREKILAQQRQYKKEAREKKKLIGQTILVTNS